MTPTAVDPPRAAAREAVARALAEDVLPLGDLTASLVEESRRAETAIVARARGVVAGRLCALEAFAQVDRDVEVDWRAADGSVVEPGSVVAQVRGPLRSILTAERTALNFVCHLSGVATATRQVVEAVAKANPSARVLDTRKTLPGLRALQKAAVRAGGGHNHRGSLSDGVLVKDNHLGALSIAEAVARARDRFPMRMIEVECDRPEQAMDAAAAGAHVVMLDNMTPDEVASTVGMLRAAGTDVLVEVSGGLTEASAPRFAAAGADLLSLGTLTHSVRALDLGLDLGGR
ncbi:MAG TPA: carboxylating nicotinate-nucleotide diphosphorylase [Acidimicrobiales bacterium]|nr:carboxylating nicotinate-nucleotide diphosphorylase [Acidimicrobiales bacterium]